MKLLIVGHARHGKDTVADLIKNLTGMRHTSSSWACAEKVMMPAFTKIEGRFTRYYTSTQECLEDRVNHRAFWYDEISAYNAADPARLVREILTTNDMYVGLRSKREFHAAKNQGLFDFAIWVDRADHLPSESRDSMTIEPWMCDFVLDNNDDLDGLCSRVKELVKLLQQRQWEYNRIRK